MNKKLLSGILALSMLCGTAFTAACEKDGKDNAKVPNVNQQQTPTTPNNPVTPPVDDRPVDTSEGYLSENVYQSDYLAANAYVASELKGAATAGELYNYEVSEEVLTEEESSALNLGDDVGNIISVRKMRVQYVDKDLDDIKEKEVYLVALTDGQYKYYVPNINTGETLLKSYYDLVASTTLSYSSVTVNTVTEEQISTSLQMYGMSMTEQSSTTNTGIWKINRDVAYYKGTSKGTSSTTMDGENTTQEIDEVSEMYIVRSPSNPEKFISLIKSTNEWLHMEYPLAYEFDTIAKTDDNYLMAAITMIEFATSDHSYFEKADFGFRTSSDKMQAYTDDIILPLTLETMSENLGGLIDVSNMNFNYGDQSFADYYLKANTLNKVDYVSDVTCTYTDYNMQMDMQVKGTSSYSGYGTTVVNIPADIQAIIDNYNS